MTEWQSIETAPARLVMLLLEDGSTVKGVPDFFPIDGYGKATVWYSMTESYRVNFTHWMPIAEAGALQVKE